jgi:hypothetical protein
VQLTLGSNRPLARWALLWRAFFEASGEHVFPHVLVIKAAFFTHLHVSEVASIEHAHIECQNSWSYYDIHDLQTL